MLTLLLLASNLLLRRQLQNGFTQGKYIAVYPILTKADAGNSLVDFTDEVGIPQVLMTDLASEFSGCVTLVLTRLCTKSLLVCLGRCRIHCWISRIDPCY